MYMEDVVEDEVEEVDDTTLDGGACGGCGCDAATTIVSVGVHDDSVVGEEITKRTIPLAMLFAWGGLIVLGLILASVYLYC